MSRILGATIMMGVFGASPAAWALSCEEIADMVGVGVPDNIVAQTIVDSETEFSEKDRRCLRRKGVPDSVLEMAAKLAVSSPKTDNREQQGMLRSTEVGLSTLCGDMRALHDRLPPDGLERAMSGDQVARCVSLVQQLHVERERLEQSSRD